MSTNWADEVDGDELPQTFTDASGITTHIEYRVNDDGRKVKVSLSTTRCLLPQPQQGRGKVWEGPRSGCLAEVTYWIAFTQQRRSHFHP